MKDRQSRWIECDCPNGSDFDLWDDVGPDVTVHCPECGGEHRLGDIGRLLETIGEEPWVRQYTEAEWRYTSEWTAKRSR